MKHRYTISKEFHFSYSHQLTGLPEDHPCSRVHGHNGILKIDLGSDELDETGFVIDYRALSPMKEYVDEVIDHYHLNDKFDFNPTSENMTKFIFDLCKEWGWPVVAVHWSETPKTWATYSE